MRIFMLVQPPGARGPVPKHTSHLVTALRSLGCTVETHPWGRRAEGVSLRDMGAQRIRDVLSVRRTLKCRSFDIAVVKTSHDWRTLIRDLAVVVAIRQRCRPIVLQLHGSRASALVEPGRPLFKLASAALLSLVDGIMVLSSEENRQWKSFRPRTPVFAVKNPYLRTPELSGASNSSRPTDRVLFVGRLIKEKGIYDLIDAFGRVREQRQCELVIVGEGPQERELFDRTDQLGLTSHVTLAGYLAGPELWQEYRDATILVLPSWSEGFPTVLAEAMDAGLPIVTTRIRGAVDHLVAGENALFVEPRDTTALASAMQTLLDDARLRARMSSANREHVAVFDPEAVAREYLDVLQKVVREVKPSRRRAVARDERAPG
jgi:glycosyltransferase involved in cell wall biosynthesis